MKSVISLFLIFIICSVAHGQVKSEKLQKEQKIIEKKNLTNKSITRQGKEQRQKFFYRVEIIRQANKKPRGACAYL